VNQTAEHNGHPKYFAKVVHLNKNLNRTTRLRPWYMTSDVQCQFWKSIVYITCTINFRYWQCISEHGSY